MLLKYISLGQNVELVMLHYFCQPSNFLITEGNQVKF